MTFLSRLAIVARFALIALVVAILWVLVSPVVAIAAAVDDPVIVIAPTSLNLVDVLQGLVVPALPALVGYVNRLSNDRIPSFFKRSMLVLLAVAGQVIPDLIESANGGKPFDLISAIFWSGAAYALAEWVYGKFYKAPLKKTRDVDVETVKTLTVGDVSVSTEIAPAPTTIASKIAGTT